jgi:translation elongation factor EF-4
MLLCRCGFLGPLHLEVFLQRLQQEYAASVISTAPTVPYELDVQGADEPLRLESIADYPRNSKVLFAYKALACKPKLRFGGCVVTTVEEEKGAEGGG